jgi:hypothetical protein
LAEVLFVGVLIERREHVQVQKIFVADIFDGVHVDLVRRRHRPYLDVFHTGAVG